VDHRCPASGPVVQGAGRADRIDETVADGVVLTADQPRQLDSLTPATGARHDEANMAAIDR
jgi:hypothetical protein